MGKGIAEILRSGLYMRLLTLQESARYHGVKETGELRRRQAEGIAQMAQHPGETFGAEPSDQGDVSVLVKALPLVPVALIIWKGDEEFPPEGNILFDRNILKMLSAEDIAWLSGMVVYPLMGMAK